MARRFSDTSTTSTSTLSPGFRRRRPGVGVLLPSRFGQNLTTAALVLSMSFHLYKPKHKGQLPEC